MNNPNFMGFFDPPGGVPIGSGSFGEPGFAGGPGLTPSGSFMDLINSPSNSILPSGHQQVPLYHNAYNPAPFGMENSAARLQQIVSRQAGLRSGFSLPGQSLQDPSMMFNMHMASTRMRSPKQPLGSDFSRYGVPANWPRMPYSGMSGHAMPQLQSLMGFMRGMPVDRMQMSPSMHSVTNSQPQNVLQRFPKMPVLDEAPMRGHVPSILDQNAANFSSQQYYNAMFSPDTPPSPSSALTQAQQSPALKQSLSNNGAHQQQQQQQQQQEIGMSSESLNLPMSFPSPRRPSSQSSSFGSSFMSSFSSELSNIPLAVPQSPKLTHFGPSRAVPGGPFEPLSQNNPLQSMASMSPPYGPSTPNPIARVSPSICGNLNTSLPLSPASLQNQQTQLRPDLSPPKYQLLWAQMQQMQYQLGQLKQQPQSPQVITQMELLNQGYQQLCKQYSAARQQSMVHVQKRDDIGAASDGPIHYQQQLVQSQPGQLLMAQPSPKPMLQPSPKLINQPSPKHLPIASPKQTSVLSVPPSPQQQVTDTQPGHPLQQMSNAHPAAPVPMSRQSEQKSQPLHGLGIMTQQMNFAPPSFLQTPQQLNQLQAPQSAHNYLGASAPGVQVASQQVFSSLDPQSMQMLGHQQMQNLNRPRLMLGHEANMPGASSSRSTSLPLNLSNQQLLAMTLSSQHSQMQQSVFQQSMLVSSVATSLASSRQQQQNDLSSQDLLHASLIDDTLTIPDLDDLDSKPGESFLNDDSKTDSLFPNAFLGSSDFFGSSNLFAGDSSHDFLGESKAGVKLDSTVHVQKQDEFNPFASLPLNIYGNSLFSTATGTAVMTLPVPATSGSIAGLRPSLLPDIATGIKSKPAKAKSKAVPKGTGKASSKNAGKSAGKGSEKCEKGAGVKTKSASSGGAKKKKGKKLEVEVTLEEESANLHEEHYLIANEEKAADSLLDSAMRRSLRERTSKKNYKDDFDYNLSDDEDKNKIEKDENSSAHGQAVLPKQIDAVIPGGANQFIAYKPSEEVEGEIACIEKILAMRSRQQNELDGDPTLMIEEYFVKYKGYSYLHCEWLDLESLTKKDRRAPSKVKRYQQKRDTSLAFLNELDDEPFNPDYLEIDRVLDTTTIADPGTGEVVNHYLVKWRALPYEESTWELEMNLDPALIEKYHQLKRLPPPDQIAIVSRPPPDHWKRFEQSPIYKGGNTLREYQLEGLNWLTFCWYKRQNCILADEMGLGKTIQSIALLCAIKNHGIRGPFLVIAPLSTIANWQREFEAWTDINAIVYHGSLQSRAHIQQYELHFKGDNGAIIPGIYKFEAIITTYEMVLSANSFLSTIPFRCLIIDEAHRLKNQKCKLVENLSNLQWEFCVLLTGTPLQNNVEELFSLLNFLDPSKFSSLAAFLIEFGDLKTESQVENLQRILKPMMLRRLKEDVEKNIAPKEETIIEVELTMIQKKFYRAILERNFSFLSKGGGNANLPSLMNTMMELRKCCNHPFLINGAEEKIVAEYVAAVDEPFRGQKRTLAMIESSGKMVLIDKLLPKLKEGGHKVLIFSQMIRVLNLIEDYLIGKRYLFERIDGSIRGDLRQAAIDRFCRPDSDRFVFLLCTRAGGLGINLTAADTVIIFDSDWNPQNDLQAQARCHRIGQEKAVKVYRLVCKNTYEREMFDRASLKLGLDKAVLQNMNNKDSGSLTGQAMSKKEVEELLKKGAYGAIMETDDDSSKFCEEDIDLILERRTQVIKIDSGQKGSTFAKASFVSDKAQMDIDLDDPDFWQKWAKKASVDVEQLEQNELIVDQPRKRKQTKRFGNVDEAVELSDLESDEDGNSSDRDLMSRQPRPKGPIERTAWTRVECFKVEKNLLVFGWGRWIELREHAHFRQHIQNTDIEAIARTILAFCFRHYRTDERTKQFFVELISESAESAPKKVDEFDITSQILSSAPSRSARGRKRGSSGRNALRRLTHQYSKPALVECGVNWLTVDPETMIIDPGYRKHLQHHCNKIMARVRLLYCLKNDVIKESSDDILSGKNASDVAFVVPAADSDLPADWWDENADKSLVMGVYKHGYEKYREIRIDPCLYFFHKLGPLSASEKQAASPDSAANPASIERLADDSSDLDFMTTAGRRSKGRGKDHDEDSPNDSEEEKDTMSSTGSPASVTSHKEPAGKHLAGTSDRHWPLASDMNTRLRRIVAAYMKSCEKEFLDTMKAEKDKQKQERIAMQVQARQRKKIEMQQRWTRREEADFYRAVSTFGVVYDTKVAKYNWDKFRQVAKLDKKQDDSLTAYYEAFMAMCRRVAGRPTEDDIRYQRGHSVDGISDERASRCLHRVELLRKIREKVLPHGKLDERLKLSQLSVEFPPWWEVVKHDKALLEGVAKHGLGRTEYHLFVDPDLPFKEILDAAAAKMKKDPVSGKKEEAIVESAKGEALEARRMENGEHSDSDSLLPSEKGFVGSPVAARKFVYPADTEDSDNRLTLNLPEEMAHILSSWPKDRAIMGHLEKLCHCVLEGEWPRAARYDILPPAKMAVVGRAPVHSVGLHSHSERAPGGISVRGDEAAAGRHGSRDFKIKSIDGLKLTVKSETKKRKRPEEDEVLHGSPPDARGEQGRYHCRNTDDASTNASVPYVVESLRDDNHGLRQKSRKKMLEGQQFPLYGGSRHERMEKGQPSRPHVQIHIPKSNKVAVVTPPHSHTRRSPRPVLHYPIHRHPSVEDLSPSIERRQQEPRSGIKVDSDKAEDRGVGDTLGIRTRRNSRVIPESDAGDASAQDMDSMYTIANAAGANSDLNRRGSRINMKEKVGSKESTTEIVLKIPDPSKYFHSKESTKRGLDGGHELLSPVDEKAVRESRLKEEYDRRLHGHESPPPVMACKSPAETTSLLGFSASSKEVVSTSSPERDSKSANGRAPQRLSRSPHSRSARAKRAGVPSPVHMIPAREFYYAERYQDRSLPASSPYMHCSHSPASPLSHVQHRPLSPRIKHRSPPLYRGRGSVSPQRRPRSRSPPRIYEHGEHIRAHRYVAPPVSPRHRGASSHVRSRSPYLMEHHAAGHVSPHSHSQEGRSFPHHSSSAAACNRVSPIIHADADRAQNLYHRGLSPPVHGQLKVEKYGFVRPSERSSSPTRHGIDRFSHDRRSPHVFEERFPYGHAIDWEHARGGSSPRNPVAAERRSPRERSPPAGRFSPFRLLTFQQEVKETGSLPSLPGSVNVRSSLVQKSKSVSSSARPPRNEATALGKNDRSGHLPTIADPPLLKNEREQSLLHSDSPPKLSTPPKLERPVSLKSDSLSSSCPGALERPPLKFYEPARFESASEAIEAAGHDTQENSHARESTSKLPRSVIEIPEPSAVPLPTSDGKVTKKRKGALEAKIQGLKDRIQQKPGGLEASIAKIKSHRLDFISKSLQVSADQGRGATPGLSSTCLESDRISSRSSASDQHVPASSASTRLSLDTTADARCLASDDVKAADGRENSVICMKFVSGPSACPVDPSNSPRPDSTCPGVPENVTVEDRVSVDIQNAS